MKILVVENSSAVCKRLLALLARSGRYEGIGCAATPAAALELVDSCHPDAVLLDQRLDGGSGFHLLETLRNRGLTMPVIMLSASQGAQYRTHAWALGANAFLCKSSQFEEIVPTLNRLLPIPGGDAGRDAGGIAKGRP